MTVEQGKLAFLVGGDAAALERVRPYLLSIGATHHAHGPAGPGRHHEGRHQSRHRRPARRLLRVGAPRREGRHRRERGRWRRFLKSVLASPMLQYRARFVLTSPAEPLFDCVMMQKDLGLALEMGRAVGVPLPDHRARPRAAGRRARHGPGRTATARPIFDVLACMSGVPMSAGGPPGGLRSGRRASGLAPPRCPAAHPASSSSSCCVTPTLIGAASLAGRRWGQGVGGVIVALPLTSGPIALLPRARARARLRRRRRRWARWRARWRRARSAWAMPRSPSAAAGPLAFAGGTARLRGGGRRAAGAGVAARPLTALVMGGLGAGHARDAARRGGTPARARRRAGTFPRGWSSRPPSCSR